MNFNIETMIQKVTDTLTTKTVIGDPIEIGEVVLIPIMNATFGFGAGSGDGKSGGNDQGSGAGGGGGARLNVAGMMVVKGEDVSFIPTGKSVSKGGSLEKILDSLPEILETLKGKSSKDKGEPSAE